MREIRCRHCGYYLLSVEADAGRLHVTCRRCKRRQTVDLARLSSAQSEGDRPADVRESGERETGRREAVECRT